MRKFLISMILGLSLPVMAQAPFALPDTSLQMDSTQNYHLGDIDIFGESALGTIYILWDNIDVDADIKKTIQEKSFANNEFFMQNIDREQFEQERLLKLFDEDRSNYYRIFPDSLLLDSLDEY